MSVSPGEYNINVQRRADYSLALQFKDSTGTAIDLTGSTVSAQIWDKERQAKYADFAIAYTDRVQGKVAMSLTDVQTESLPDPNRTSPPVSLYYDVLVTTSGGLKDYYLEGKVTASEGYTS